MIVVRAVDEGGGVTGAGAAAPPEMGKPGGSQPPLKHVHPGPGMIDVQVDEPGAGAEGDAGAGVGGAGVGADGAGVGAVADVPVVNAHNSRCRCGRFRC
jgi:hypothetical protein